MQIIYFKKACIVISVITDIKAITLQIDLVWI